MAHPNYKKSILVTADAYSSYKAITCDVENWWTRPDKPLANVGDRAKFTFPPGISYWTFELTQANKPIFVEWTCVDALHIHEGQPKEIETEWLDTKINWTIERTKDSTKIEIEHVGLNPTLLCYDICEAGWDIFFLNSLKSYLDTGVGSPHSHSG